METKNNDKKKIILIAVTVFLFTVAITLTTYAFFNYTRTGPANSIGTGIISFNFETTNMIDIDNQFPISEDNVGAEYECAFNIKAHTTIPNGIEYKIFAVPGDDKANGMRLLDSVMKMSFEPAADGNGFTTVSNNYSTPSTLSFTNGVAVISTGRIKDTSAMTTKTYKVKLWIDEDSIFISSTIKRANNAEGNPSLANATEGNVTADRYMHNDGNLTSTTLYPAVGDQIGKIIYTTNEFKNAYYTLKIGVEAYDVE